MSREAVRDDLSVVLSEFARTLVTDFPIQGILDHLVSRIVDIMPVDAAGVTLISADVRPRLIAGSDESASRFEQLQTDLWDGPCVAAFKTDGPISIPDLSVDDRFPTFAAQAQSEGLLAVFTFPLRNDDRCLGALELYRKTAGPLDAVEMATAQTLADVTTAYLLNAEARVAKTEFVANVSHELRTPLSSIRGFVELLQDDVAGELNQTQTDFVDAIGRSSRRLMAMADDVLIMSRLEPGSRADHDQDVDFGGVVRAAQAALASAIAASRLEVTFHIPAQPAVVRGDASSLESVVTNLVGNSLKFTPDGGWVKCTVRATHAHVCLEVRDNGIGIPLNEQGRLFGRFFRSSNAEKHAVQGSGLGLSIADSIVRSHGGEISVKSADMGGSTFTVTLPVAHSDGELPLPA